jgi:hypothetical protein
MTDVGKTQKELAGHLAKLEAGKEGNSDLAWRIRDYIRAVERLTLAMPVSDQTI